MPTAKLQDSIINKIGSDGNVMEVTYRSQIKKIFFNIALIF